MKKVLSLLVAFSLIAGIWLPIRSVVKAAGADKASFDLFGDETELQGDWTVSEETNVGKTFKAKADTTALLNSSAKDFGIDLKVKTETGITVGLRSAGTRAYELTVGKGGVKFSGNGVDEFIDASLNTADGKWHSVGIKIKGERVIVIFDGIKVMDKAGLNVLDAGELYIKAGKDAVLSGIAVKSIKKEDMDTVAEYDFSTDTYPNTFVNQWINWQFDKTDGVGGIAAEAGWNEFAVKSASTAENVQNSAKVKDFALNIKYSAEQKDSGNAYQRGLQFNLPNGDNLQIHDLWVKYNSNTPDKNKAQQISSLGEKQHTVDIVSKGTELKVYFDNNTTPVFTCEQTEATAEKLLSINTALSNGSKLKINSLNVKTGAGVHDLVVEKDPPKLEESTVKPYYTSFGKKTDLGGTWGSYTGENVGDTFKATADNEIALSGSLKDFGMDFKVMTPAEALAPFAVLARKNGDSAYELSANKAETAGVYFGGYSENAFTDASLNIADGQWHSVGLKMRGDRAILLVDGVKVADYSLKDKNTDGALIIKAIAETCISDLKIYSIKGEDLDTVAEYDFSTDTYPNALSGIAWKYDGGLTFETGENGENNDKALIKSVSKNSEVQKLAMVDKFAMEIKYSVDQTKVDPSKDLPWQRGMRFYLPILKI